MDEKEWAAAICVLCQALGFNLFCEIKVCMIYLWGVCGFGYVEIEWEDLFKGESADYKEKKEEDKSIKNVDSIQDYMSCTKHINSTRWYMRRVMILMRANLFTKSCNIRVMLICSNINDLNALVIIIM